MKRAVNTALQFAPAVRRAVFGDRIVVLSALHSLMASKSIFGRVHECIETSAAPCVADRKVASIYIRKLFAMGALTTEAPEVELVSWSDRRRLLHEPTSFRKPIVVIQMEPDHDDFTAAALQTLALRRPVASTIEFYILNNRAGTLRPLLASGLQKDTERRFFLQALDLIRPAEGVSQVPLAVVTQRDQPGTPFIAGLGFRELAEDLAFGFADRRDALLAWLDRRLQFGTPRTSAQVDLMTERLSDRRSQYLRQLLVSGAMITLESDEDQVWRGSLDQESFLSISREKACFDALARRACLSVLGAEPPTFHSRHSWFLTRKQVQLLLRKHRQKLQGASLQRKETLLGTRYAIA